jgi:N-acylneuraminate cytidylyltransferase/CMP-N,N'-diacetyllegionaminic acid synthase
MYNGDKILALITARGGSKGLPGKNIRPLCGKPLIAWTIEAAKESKYIDRVMVSTEDGEIAEISRKWGAEVIGRPEELARDDTPSIPVVLHAIQQLREKENYTPDITVLLQPTSPLRTGGHIDTAIEKLEEHKTNVIVSVAEVRQYPHWMKKVIDGRLVPFIEGESVTASRQKLPQLYIPNGAIYAAKTEYLLERKTFYDEDTIAFIMGREESIDIDDEFDFKLAEYLMGTYDK